MNLPSSTVDALLPGEGARTGSAVGSSPRRPVTSMSGCLSSAPFGRFALHQTLFPRAGVDPSRGSLVQRSAEPNQTSWAGRLGQSFGGVNPGSGGRVTGQLVASGEC